MNAAIVVARRFGAERRTLTLGVAVGAMLTLFLQVAMYPSVRDSVGEMAEDLPEAFTRLIGSSEFASPEGFLQAEAYGSMAPILVILVAVSTAASSLAGTEASGRMALIATSSASRRAIAGGAAASMLGSVTVIVGAYWFASVVGSALGDLDIAVSRLTAAALSLWLLGAAVGAIAFAVGGLTGRRGTALGVATSVAVFSFLAYGLLPLSDDLAGGRYFSLWYPYADHRPLEEGADLLNVAVLAAVALAGLGVGVRGFERRDLG